MLNELIRPLDEVLNIRWVGMTAIMLPPRKLTVEKPNVKLCRDRSSDRRKDMHFLIFFILLPLQGQS
jgi:hypothetical protein